MFLRHVKQLLKKYVIWTKDLFKKRSLVLQLIGVYTLATLIILIIINAALYFTLQHSLFKHEKQLLVGEYQIIHKISQVSKASHNISQEIAALLPGKRSAIRVLSAKHKVVFETPEMERRAPAINFPPLEPGAKDAFEITKCAACKKPMLLLSGALFNPVTQGAGTVQIALSTHAEEELLEDYWKMLNYIAISGLIAAMLIGWLLARHAMRPLNEITQMIEQISTQKLHNRLLPNNWPKEFTCLATRLNGKFARLEEAFMRLTQFASDLAHELRTPLNNLKGEAETTLLKPRDVIEYQHILSSSLEEYERLTRLIDGILFLAKAEIPQNKLNYSEINVRKLVEAVFRFYMPIAEEHGINLTCEGNAILWADKLLLERVLHNLCSNALRYTPSYGTIHVQLETTATETCIRFSDTGSGIAPEHLPYVFNRFYRVDSSRTKFSGGSGLGLAIVKSIMTMHKGTVNLTSEVDKGTSVVLTFPEDIR